jgi:hypothetical protein
MKGVQEGFVLKTFAKPDSCLRCLPAGASFCTACVEGTYINSTGAVHD